MATAISSSRADSASVPGVRASALIGWSHLNGFKSLLLPWLVGNKGKADYTRGLHLALAEIQNIFKK